MLVLVMLAILVVIFGDVHACDVGLDGDSFGDAGDLGIGEVGVIVVGVGGVCADDA